MTFTTESTHRTLDDLGVVIGTKRFGERDLILQIFTEKYGRVPAIAKGGVQSRRFGGTLQLMAFSQFHFVQKPHSELARLDSATLRTQFDALPKHYTAFAVSSFFMEFAGKALEAWSPAREFFLILANAFFHLNQTLQQSSLDLETEKTVSCAYLSLFILKAMSVLGYDPKITHCGICGEEFQAKPSLWNPQWGGFLCETCKKVKFSGATQQLTMLSHISEDTYSVLRVFSRLSFQSLTLEIMQGFSKEIPEIQEIMIQFMQFHLTHCDLTTLSMIRENSV